MKNRKLKVKNEQGFLYFCILQNKDIWKNI